VSFVVIVEPVSAGNLLAGFVVEGVVERDDTLLGHLCVVVSLKQIDAFLIESAFVPVVVVQEIIQRAFVLGWKETVRNPLNSLVTGANQPGCVGFDVPSLMVRERVELINEAGA
jgi:hypothetical protein